MVSVVPPDTEAPEGEIVPIPSGTAASWTTVTAAFCAVPSEEVMAKSL